MATATISQELALEQLYIAYFGRAAEPAGFTFFLNGIAAGTDSLANIANEFANSAESQALYPFLGVSSTTPLTTTAATAFVTQVYNNLFNRAPEESGRAYWVSVLTSKNAGDVINGIANGALGHDKEALSGKDLAALNYTTSVTDATYNAGDSVAAVAGAYTLTTNVDVATSNIFNSTLSSAGLLSFVNTLQDTDKLTGVGTNPTLNVQLGTIDGLNAGAQSHIVTPALTNLQTINIDFIGNGGSSSTSTSTTVSGGSTTTSTTTTTSTGSGATDTLDLQDSNPNSIKTVNINRITDSVSSVAVVNFTGVPTNLSVNNTSSPTASVSFKVLDAVAAGATDSTTLTLNNVVLHDLNLNSSGDVNGAVNNGISTDATGNRDTLTTVNTNPDGIHLKNTPNVVFSATGIETVNLVTKGAANSVGTFSDVDLTTLNITGDKNLTIGEIGYLDQGKFATIDGHTVTGNLDLSLDSLTAAANATPFDTTGGDVAFHLTTGTGNDTINSTVNFGSHTYVNDADHTLGFNDVVDAGAGLDTLALSSSVEGFVGKVSTLFTGNTSSNEVSFTDNATYHNFEAVTVTRTGTAYGNGSLAMYVDSANITDENKTGQTFTLVNKQDVKGSHDQTIYVLENLTPTESQAITILHSGLNAQSYGNNALEDNVIIAELAADTKSDTVGVTIGTGTNTDPRFNFVLSATAGATLEAVENVTITDADKESNTVGLFDYADEKGTITLAGGVAGQFLNLDVASVNSPYSGSSSYSGGGYGLDTTGDNVDLANEVAADKNPDGTDKNTDTKVSDVYGKNSYQRSFLTAATSGATLVATKIDATAEKSDVIVRVGAADQNIQLGSGNDTVVYADRAGTTIGTAGFSLADTVAGGTGFDTIAFDGTGDQRIRYSEFENVTGIDAIRLAGTTGSNITLELSNHLAGQTDNGSRILVINNDGDIHNNSENLATIDFTHLDGLHYGTFIGANGDGTWNLGSRNPQTVILNDVTANDHNILNGGDNDVSAASTAAYALASTGNALWATNYGSEASFYFDGIKSTAFDGSLGSHTDGNNNVLRINNDAVVTIADLSNVSNFHTIEFYNTTTVNQQLDLTLDNTTVDRLADASHTATATQTEALTIKAFDNYTAGGFLISYANLNLQAGTLGANFNLTVDLYAGPTLQASGTNTIVTGAGNDVINVLSSAGNNTINAGAGADIINLDGANATASSNTLVYSAKGQTHTGAIVDTNTILNPTESNNFDAHTGVDVVTLGTGAVSIPKVTFNIAAVTSGVTTTAFSAVAGNLLNGTTNEVHVTTGLYDLATHEFTAGGGTNADALVQWDTNGVTAGGVETVAIVGQGHSVSGVGAIASGVFALTVA